MSQGTIYIFPQSPRSFWIHQIISDLNLDITIKDNKSEEFGELFPLKKCPAFIDSTGFKLTETPVIYKYLVSLAENSTFGGVGTKEEASVAQWLNFTNQDFSDPIAAIVYICKDEESKEKNKQKAIGYFEYVNNTLADKKWLVGNQITIADIYLFKCFKGFSDFVGGVAHLPNIVRWMGDVETEKPIYKALY